MFQRLPIAFAETKAGDTSENLLKEVLQITCSFEQKSYRFLSFAKNMSKYIGKNISKD